MPSRNPFTSFPTHLCNTTSGMIWWRLARLRINRKRKQNADKVIFYPLQTNHFFQYTTQWLLVTDFVILNHGQVTRTTPELTASSPNFHTTPTGERLTLDIFNVYRPPMQGGSSVVTDEAHFWLNGYVNKQNGRIWSEANPQV
ncbi:hypothetical protein TNCV_725641 [Trichonephila clavipes]|nr:hypothetical protein TNCV_725641 [Trichonephila clavipes]